MQDLIRKLPGVQSTRVGYTGGDVANATYRNHHGHAEAIEITFDPETTSYRDLLEFFFQIHDPTTLDRQGDVGTSYRSAIFYLDAEQRCGRGHHRRRRRLRSLARQGGHRSDPGRALLGSGTRAPGLLEHYERLHLPLPRPGWGCPDGAKPSGDLPPMTIGGHLHQVGSSVDSGLTSSGQGVAVP
jgi:methionine-S-sulfoxide reductase